MTTAERDETSAGARPAGYPLRLPRCRRCERVFWYPRVRCPRCRSNDIEQVASHGRGTLYSFSTLMIKSPSAPEGPNDRIVAYVELDEGPFVLATLTGLTLEQVYIGMRLEATAPTDAEPLQFRDAVTVT